MQLAVYGEACKASVRYSEQGRTSSVITEHPAPVALNGTKEIRSRDSVDQLCDIMGIKYGHLL
jgi:hypothetical protein